MIGDLILKIHLSVNPANYVHTVISAHQEDV